MHSFPVPESKSQDACAVSPDLQPPNRRTLLLVDDEPNILSALRRLLRGDGYHILSAGSSAEGLALLQENVVDVIVSDQRMPGLTGVEFLGIARKLHPETIRIVLTGYTELQSIFGAVNEGAVYKFLTKPWDEGLLREHIRAAFVHKELAEDNRRLIQEVQCINRELAATNRQLGLSLAETRQQVELNMHMLEITREVLQGVDIPVLAIDDQLMIAFANDAAATLLQRRGALLGADARLLLPEIMQRSSDREAPCPECVLTVEQRYFWLMSHAMGTGSQSRGQLITLIPAALPAAS